MYIYIHKPTKDTPKIHMQVGIKGQCGISQNYLNCFEARPGQGLQSRQSHKKVKLFVVQKYPRQYYKHC